MVQVMCSLLALASPSKLYSLETYIPGWNTPNVYFLLMFWMMSLKGWYLRRTMLMNYSVKIWLSFSKLTLMDLLIFHQVQPPFILLKNTWRLFIRLHWTLMEYHPFKIKFWQTTKERSMLLTKYGNLQGKHQLFLFQPSRQCFISVLRNIDFLNRHWSCYSNFTFKLNLLHKITKNFLGINQHFLSNVVIAEKKSFLQKHLQTFYSWHQWLHVIIWKCCHQSLLSMNQLFFLGKCSPFHLHRKLFCFKKCIWQCYL